jgi:hypothetical protein
MAFTLPPLNFSNGGTGPLDSASQVGTPINVSVPWQSTKNYQNHTSGSSQSATASADQSAGGSSFGGIDMKWILIGAAAWLLLR